MFHGLGLNYDMLEKYGEPQRLSKGSFYKIRFRADEAHRLFRLRLGLAQTVLNPREQNTLRGIISKEILAGELAGIYLGRFMEHHVSVAAHVTSNSRKSLITTLEGQSLEVFYIPQHDEFLLVPLALQPLLSLERSELKTLVSKVTKNVSRVDTQVLMKYWARLSDVKGTLESFRGFQDSVDATFLTKVVRDEVFARLDPLNNKKLSEL